MVSCVGTGPTAGLGARVRDAEDREYIDYVGSWGPLIAGHSHPRVVAAVQQQAALGTSFGAPTELETELARRIHERSDSLRPSAIAEGPYAMIDVIAVSTGPGGFEMQGTYSC